MKQTYQKGFTIVDKTQDTLASWSGAAAVSCAASAVVTAPPNARTWGYNSRTWNLGTK